VTEPAGPPQLTHFPPRTHWAGAGQVILVAHWFSERQGLSRRPGHAGPVRDAQGGRACHKMRGSVYKRGSTWTWHVDVGVDPVTGRRRQQTNCRRPGLSPPPTGGRRLHHRGVRRQDTQGPPIAGTGLGHPGRAQGAPGLSGRGEEDRRQRLPGVRTCLHHARRVADPSAADLRLVLQHIRAAGLPRIRLHDVRHSYATDALAAGVPPKVISQRLGHATIAITMDTYSHVIPGLDEQAAETVA
jgi:Phage integrase family